MSVINCYECYRLHRHADVVFCPFFDLDECCRGKHKIVIPEKKKKRTKKAVKFKDSLKKHCCYPYRVYIIQSLLRGIKWTDIGRMLGIGTEYIHYFVKAVMDHNQMYGVAEFKNWTVEDD